MNGLKLEHIGSGPAAAPLIDLLRVMADPIRLRLLRLLELQAATGLSVGELADILKLPQSTVSRHLKTLTDAGLIDATRDGTSMLYRLTTAATVNSARQLRAIAKSHLDHDPVAAADSARLAAILRRRTPDDATFFGKHAPEWDQIRNQWFGESFHLEALLALLDPTWTVADLGTGTGLMLPLLAPHVKQIIAVEPAPAMLKRAKARIGELHLANVDLRQGSLEQLPIDKNSCDIALLTLVLGYTESPLLALRNVHRILKPNGRILITDLQPHNVAIFQEKLNQRHMGFSAETITATLHEAGFDSIRIHPIAPKTARSKDANVAVPDLFVARAIKQLNHQTTK